MSALQPDVAETAVRQQFSLSPVIFKSVHSSLAMESKLCCGLCLCGNGIRGNKQLSYRPAELIA